MKIALAYYDWKSFDALVYYPYSAIPVELNRSSPNVLVNLLGEFEQRIDDRRKAKLFYLDSDHVEYHREISCTIMTVVEWRISVVEPVTAMSR